MNTITVSATKARNEFFSLIEWASAVGRSVIVEKDRKVLVKIVPAVSDQEVWKIKKRGLLRAVKESEGILKGEKFKSPLRGKRANTWLGRWDRDLNL